MGNKLELTSIRQLNYHQPSDSNNVFLQIIFEADVAGSIVDLVLKRLKFYKNFKHMNQFTSNLLLNYLLILIEDKNYKLALKKANEVIDYCKTNRNYRNLGISLIRKGIILSNLDNEDYDKWYSKGFNVLKYTYNTDLIEILVEEIKTYTNTMT